MVWQSSKLVDWRVWQTEKKTAQSQPVTAVIMKGKKRTKEPKKESESSMCKSAKLRSDFETRLKKQDVEIEQTNEIEIYFHLCPLLDSILSFNAQLIHIKLWYLLDESVLKWWKVQHAILPNLWKLACRYLAISATSAPSERV